jgi:hypothetical protein
MQSIYKESSTLQYDLALRTSGYLDVSFEHPPEAIDEVPASSIIIAGEKAALLTSRENKWAKLDAAAERYFEIKGPAGVYELQEGIFLMCDEYSELDDGKVSTPSALS